MTDEHLDEKIRGAYAHTELSPEAEERILANLLAAEEARAAKNAAGEVIALPVKRRRKPPAWIAPSIAAALLVGIFAGGNFLLSSGADSASSLETGGAIETTSSPDRSTGISEESPYKAEGVEEMADSDRAEVIALEDGRRFAIEDVATDVDDSDELAWESAIVESTGDPCETALLEDGTLLVRFEDGEVLYRAFELPK